VPLRLTEVAIDCHDVERLVAFWSAALGYVRLSEGEGWVAIGPPGPDVPDDVFIAHPHPPNLAICAVPEDKVVKNRMHVDVTPVQTSQRDEVARLTALGAATVDIGQGEEKWIVMADPEGNEFCVMPEFESPTP
jgi:hypothetical protein